MARLQDYTSRNRKAAVLIASAARYSLVDYLRTGDVLGLETLRTSLDLELHLRTLLERPVSIHLDSREVHEYIIAVGPLDEAIALRGVKPFNYAFFSHY
jgi:hypothetical protein